MIDSEPSATAASRALSVLPCDPVRVSDAVHRRKDCPRKCTATTELRPRQRRETDDVGLLTPKPTIPKRSPERELSADGSDISGLPRTAFVHAPLQHRSIPILRGSPGMPYALGSVQPSHRMRRECPAGPARRRENLIGAPARSKTPLAEAVPVRYPASASSPESGPGPAAGGFCLRQDAASAHQSGQTCDHGCDRDNAYHDDERPNSSLVHNAASFAPPSNGPHISPLHYYSLAVISARPPAQGSSSPAPRLGVFHALHTCSTHPGARRWSNPDHEARRTVLGREVLRFRISQAGKG